MTVEKYIVLRSSAVMVPTFENLGTRAGAAVAEALPERLEIEEAELTRAERSDLRRDPRTRAVAPPMPMKLIEPTASEDISGAAASANATWGVEAVAWTG